MMRSLYAGVSGLQNHQTRMDVVGNNIANVNTNGFKKGRVTFQDMLSQTMTGAARPGEDRGGVNPKQVGLGMQVAAVDTIHTQGALKVTGVNTDLAITGKGFFVLKKGEQTFFSRNGAFSIDRDGRLVNPANGLRVQGWTSEINADGEYTLNTAASVSDIVLPMNDKDPARATENMFFECNLRKSSTTHQSDMQIYDSTGTARQVRFMFSRNPEDVNEWSVDVQMQDDEILPQTLRAFVGNDPGDQSAQGNANSTSFRLRFNNNGALESIANPGGEFVNVNEGDELNASMAFSYVGTDGEPNEQTISLRLGESGMFRGITQAESASTTKVAEQDGWSMGMLQGFNIDDSGIITGVYTNGNTRSLAQISVAKFTNPGGLEKNGESMYRESNNSGPASVGAADMMGRGKIRAGALEMSNVDLAGEFTDMIVTQRGFQANSRSITTSDQMLQELLSLKR